MTELINKEELLRRFADFGREIPKDIVIGVIASAKEDIVRCKDCKWYESGGLPCPLDLCESLGDEGFCSYGERRVMIKRKFRKKPIVIEAYQTDRETDIDTLEGTMHANIGDWIITGVHGEQYPCKADIFKETYEEVDE